MNSTSPQPPDHPGRLDGPDPADRSDRLAAALDHAIPTLPGRTGPADAVRLGRRALVRRRLTTGVAAAAVVATAGATTALVANGTTPGSVNGSVSFATGPTDGVAPTTAAGRPSERPGQSAPVDPGSEFVVRPGSDVVVDPDAESVGITDDGRLVTPPGVEVLGVVEEPAGLRAPAHSVAAEVRMPDAPQRYRTQWVYATIQPDLVADGTVPLGVEEDGRTGVQGPASADPSLSFTQWLFTAVEYGVPAWPYSGLPSEPLLTLDGDLVLPTTARLVDQVENPWGVDGSRTSLAIAWVDPADPVSSDEQWAVLVLDPAWRTGEDNPLGLTNGFAWERQAAEAGVDFDDWAATRSVEQFEADSPPAWGVGGSR